ncbi:uncharacterized protein LOC133649220 [Entelurus aequoreus]|uniref:uncharacterized protein LOC133649220 n=1 Tax=Entelurus aequoreus TaxID=161455 RepID=UPI002B1D73C3|nr:uncharacterized protein LOC133649220 [Entelurus aequoreus]
MTLNASRSWHGSLMANSSCGHNMTEWEELMDKMYTYFYLLLFIPGLLLNTIALWFFCTQNRKKIKTVIFMVNLALADLVHILSLPLRIYYYLTHTWPFGHIVCLLCFYLKYLNMYAAIGFLTCISVQRCVFLLDPFSTRRWRSRFDLAISVLVWVLVGLACSPFIVMRASSSASNPSITSQHVLNKSAFLHVTQEPARCFKDLPMRQVPLPLGVTLMVFCELFGFLIPLVCISYSSVCISRSLYQSYSQASGNSSLRRLSSFTSADINQTNGEKRHALRMVLSCSIVFLLCFAPYHINFLLYLMVQQGLVSDCAFRLAVRQFHPVSLCLANLSCCLNPLLYYFLTAEFKLHFSRRTLSSTSSHTLPTRSAELYKLGVHRVRTVLCCVWFTMNDSCNNTGELRTYQHHVYAVVYSVILIPGLLGNILALWVFRVYIRETKKAVVFMMNLAVADLMQVLSLPLRIYYYLNDSWPFGRPLCMICFYLKYVNMYASIFFLVCVSLRRCELIMRPLRYNTSRRKVDVVLCTLGWLSVCLGCLAFPLLRHSDTTSGVFPPEVGAPLLGPDKVCFSELPMQMVGASASWAILLIAELLGFIIPFTLVLACTCLTAGSLRRAGAGAVPDRGEKRRALKMVLSCAAVFLVCFAPYHITMPLDFLAKANVLSSCALRDLILRCHPVTLCLASLNCCLDPIMYYFTTNEFWKRLSKPDILVPESLTASRHDS